MSASPSDSLALLLVRPRFPENIGMCARACANMGVSQIVLVQPERWNMEAANPLATSQATSILQHIQVAASLPEALAPFNWAVATTARLGGWRRNILHPEQAARTIHDVRINGGRAALVLGSEDKGLTNEEISQCDAIAHISTDAGRSLNLAQAAMIMLYECHKLGHRPQASKNEQHIDHEEQQRLEAALQQALLALDCLRGQNPAYDFLQWQHLLRRCRLKRHEYDAFMGLCRQIRNKVK